jgi:hypothetical protein
MRTTRTGHFPGLTRDDVLRLLAERFLRLGFNVASPMNADLIRLSRPKRPIDKGSFEIFTHASKPMEAELQIAHHDGHVEVRVTLWTEDLVIMDTGEGRHIDQCLEYILAQKTDDNIITASPSTNVSMKSITSLTCGIWLLAISSVQLHHWFNLPRAIDFMFGFTVASFSGVTLGALGLIDTFRKPKEMTGRMLSIIGIGLTLLAFLIAIGIFYQSYGTKFMK